MGIGKRFFKHPRVQKILVGIIYWYSECVYSTSSWKGQGKELFNEALLTSHPIVVAVWHGRILLAPKFPIPDRKHYAVISLHGDGEYVAHYMERHNVTPVRGSSKRGALSAFREAVKILKKGHVLVITPDGPRGPGMQWGGNTVALAKLSGAAIIPYAQATNRCRFLKSWDRFCLPLPFGKGVYMYGEPVYIPPDASDEDMKKAGIELQNRLNRLTRQADEYVGVTSVVPVA